LTLRVVENAALEIEEAGTWWRANRPSAPELLSEELDRAFDLILQQPGIGARALNTRLPGVRRIHLRPVRYHVLGDVVEVLGLWHSSRGSGPDL